MAEEVPDRPILSKYQGKFHVVAVAGRMLQNGNKLRIVLEGEYSADLMNGLSPMFDKDCDVRFKEMATQKHRSKYGEEETPALPGVEDEPEEA